MDLSANSHTDTPNQVARHADSLLTVNHQHNCCLMQTLPLSAYILVHTHSHTPTPPTHMFPHVYSLIGMMSYPSPGSWEMLCFQIKVTGAASTQSASTWPCTLVKLMIWNWRKKKVTALFFSPTGDSHTPGSLTTTCTPVGYFSTHIQEGRQLETGPHPIPDPAAFRLWRICQLKWKSFQSGS